MERVHQIHHPEISEVLVYPTKELTVKSASQEIIELVKLNPLASITYATGDTMIPVYENLATAVDRGLVDFSQTTAFHLDEYYPYSQERKFSFVKFLNNYVFGPLKINPDNIHTLNGIAEDPHIEAKRYDDLVSKRISLALLGIDPRGHIGFNERNTPFDSRTHLALLSNETLHRDIVERSQDTPNQALTQGIGTILEASQILLIAYGIGKSSYIREALINHISEFCPASALRLVGKKVTVLVDEKAGNLVK